MTDWFCDTELATGANDGSSMDDAWQSIKTAMENVVMVAGDICWFRRRSNFYNPTANIAPTIDGTLKDPIQWIGWPRNELKGNVDFINGSNVLAEASVSPKFERHAGRYIRNNTDGRDYLLTAIAQELKYSNKSGEFTEGLMVTGQSSGASGKIHQVVDNGDGTGTLWIVSKSRNLIDRGDCEDVLPPMIFGEFTAVKGNVIWDRDYSQFYDGKASFKFTKNVAAGTLAYINFVDNNDQEMHGLTADRTCKLKARFKVQSGGIDVDEIKLRIMDFLGSWETVEISPTKYDEWEEVELVKAIRAGATGIILRLLVEDTAELNEYFNVDVVQLWEVFEDNEQITDTDTGVANVNGTPVDKGFIIDRPYVGDTEEAGAFTIAKDEDHALAQAIDDLAWTIKKADYNGDADEHPIIDFGQLSYYLRPSFSYDSMYKNFSFRNGAHGYGTVSPSYTYFILFKGCHFLQYNHACCLRSTVDEVNVERFIARGSGNPALTNQKFIYGVHPHNLKDGAMYNFGSYCMLGATSKLININAGIELPGYINAIYGSFHGYDIKIKGISTPWRGKGNVHIENYQKVKGAHILRYYNGSIINTDVVVGSGDPQKRPGGADSVIEVTANVSAAYEAIEEWAQEIFCHEIWADLTSKSYRYYVQCKNMESDQNLLGLWRFDETTGLIAADSSKYGNDGDLEGTFTDDDWVTGKSNNALSFGGVNQRVDCGNAAPLNTIGNGSFWIPFWMKSKDAVPSNYGALFYKWEDNTNQIHLSSSGTDNRIRFYIAKTGIAKNILFSISSAPFDTFWRHVVLVVNRTTEKALLYVDTVKDSIEGSLTGLPADASNSANISWGARHDGGVYLYKGLIDEGGVYKGLPTKAKIDYLYANPPGRASHLSTLPSQLWLEVEYCDQYDGPSKYRYVKVKSTRECLERTGADDWSQYLEVIGIQPAVAGLVRIRGFISHYDPDGMVYIDPKVVIS